MNHDPVTHVYAHVDALIAAGVILRRHDQDGDRWLLLRSTKHHEWGFAKGHQDNGEDLVQTALRECAEECGIALFAIEGEALELNYRLPNGRRKRAVYFPAFTATETVVLSNEHDAWRWARADEVRGRLPHATMVRLFESYLRSRKQH